MSVATWNSVVQYLVNDRVDYQGVEYLALQNNQNVLPTGLAPNWALFNPPATPVVDALNTLTGNLQIVDGGGITVATPNATDIELTNAGVLSLDSQTGNVITNAGFFYATANQNITSGATQIVQFQVQQFNYGNAITVPVAPSFTQFTVQKRGIYNITFHSTTQANGSTWTATTNKTVGIRLTRGVSTTNQLVSTGLQASGIGFAESTTGTLLLEIGDILECYIINNFSGGPPFIQGVQNLFDYNNFFSYELLVPL